MIKKRIHIVNAKVLIMGLAFKENCPDIRNSKVSDLISGFGEYDCLTDVYDPWVDKDEAQKEYGIGLVDEKRANTTSLFWLLHMTSSVSYRRMI